MASRDQAPSVQSTALGHLRVVELGDIPAAYCASYLGGLGADVIKVEPPAGDPNRWLPPFAGDIEDPDRSLTFLNANTNKRSIVLDLNQGGNCDTLGALLSRADILVEATPPGHLAALGFSKERLQELNPGLVTVSLTPFGQWGPYSGYRGGDAIFSAMSGFLASRGDDKRPPVVPPGQFSSQLAAVHGAYLALAAVRHRRRTGLSQRIDLSLQEALTYATMSAIAQYSQRNEIPKRPGMGGGISNIYRTKDGRYVHLGIYIIGHSHTLTREWMEDPVLSMPEWDDPQYLADNGGLAQHLVGQFVLQFDADEFVAEAQRRGLPCAPVNTIGQFVDSDHMRERAWFQEVHHPVVGIYKAPGPPVWLSLTPYRISRSAPLLDQHREEILAELRDGRPPTATSAPPAEPTSPMLEGIRVADITRGWAGPIGTMFLGFYGAEVIKVESADLPANRNAASPFYPDVNRNKLSCTMDLRHPQGKELMRRLVATSDILVENFSPTVMERLGFGYEETRKVKPDLIQVSMPGMGSSGPLGRWVTWGPSLEAFSGFTRLWGYSDSPTEAHSKGAAPDYVGAAFLALASLAALEYRDRTGEGQFIEIAQVESMAALLGPAMLDYTVNGHSWESVGYGGPLAAPLAPFGCYPCRYPDTWIVIACEKDDDWHNLVRALDEPSWATDPRFADHIGRQQHRDELDRHLADWTSGFTPHQALRLLQKADVAAGIAMNAEHLYHDPHLRARGHLVELEEPPWGRLTHQGLPGIPSLSTASASKPTPWIGEHNGYVFRQIMGLSPAEMARWEEAGAIR